ncbi:hypothetical protein ATI61_104382 [Archangium gephyra]|uniref:Uncharacterized protein n=1 Tax=Archangium gephyra TaxID=48 RepID=A0AAC8Q3E1_9BACT|nr:hypothetical protein [Archangium gephyra]AKJ00209.1 Hypothetical protein AA314_01835 [Archangium gephyra]REG33092.1 hypothetical protein ATI61_104382 [Archangium gephyra]
MKTLLAVLQLTLVSPEPAPASEQPVSTPPSESQRVLTIDFEDEDLELDLSTYETECFPDRRCCFWRPLIRIREDFNDKVMKSVAEM